MGRENWCILTEPVPRDGRERAYRATRRVLTWRLDGDDLGHPGVTKSLIRGLRHVGKTFKLNPLREELVGRVCVVLSSVRALRQAIEWKRAGRIELLLAGPNLMVRSNEHDGILAAPQIDGCLVPSEWVATAYVEDVPALAGRVHVWYAGVDESYWAPLGSLKEKRDALIYCKNVDAAIVRSAETALERAGWPIIRIVYGSYSKSEFRAALLRSKFAVFLSPSESQGIALAEAWSMDVPTLAWEPRELVIGEKRYAAFSASPYLNAQVGVRWTTEEDLKRLLEQIPVLLSKYSPRAWIQENMTDVHSALKLSDLVDKLMQTGVSSAAPGAG